MRVTAEPIPMFIFDALMMQCLKYFFFNTNILLNASSRKLIFLLVRWVVEVIFALSTGHNDEFHSFIHFPAYND